MNEAQIQGAVRKFLLITDYYGWDYDSLEDTYLDMPFYAIAYRNGKYFLPTKQPSDIDERDIEHLQMSLNEFLRDTMGGPVDDSQMDERQAQAKIDGIAQEHPKKAQEFRHVVKKYPRHGYTFYKKGLDTPLLHDEVIKALHDNPNPVYLSQGRFSGLEYLYHYKNADIFNLKRPDVDIPLAPIYDDEDNLIDNHQYGRYDNGDEPTQDHHDNGNYKGSNDVHIDDGEDLPF